MLAGPPAVEEYRSGGVALDEHGDNQEEGREAQEAKSGYQDVEPPA